VIEESHRSQRTFIILSRCAGPVGQPGGRRFWPRSLGSGFGFGDAGSLDGEVQPVAGDHYHYPGESEGPADQDIGEPVVAEKDPAQAHGDEPGDGEDDRQIRAINDVECSSRR
jgi:hypothetical protein